MSDLHTLLEQKKALEQQAQALDAQIAEMRQSKRREVIQHIKTLLSENGLTVADLEMGGAARKKGASTGKVAPKYKDPATGKTWTGRGIKPTWMRDALAAGKTVNDFRIPDQE